jgi:hypothetical protein
MVIYLVKEAMKFQKGILSGNEPERQPSNTGVETSALPEPAMDGHLFETLEEEEIGGRRYFKLFAVVVILVIVAGAGIAYFTLPGVGDKVRASPELELAVRDHFLLKEKRTATDVTFYQCEGFLSVRVGVETRTDIPNPIFRLDTYSARVVQTADRAEITAAPVAAGDQFFPCK